MDKLKLRNQAIEDILKELDRFLLTRQSFNYSFNNANGEIVSLEYKENPSFRFIIKQPTKTYWKTVECPGRYFISDEEFEFRNFSECRSRIFTWVQRLVQEIAVNSKDEPNIIKELRENLEQNINKLENPHEPFNVEDANTWVKRVDETFDHLESIQGKLKIQEDELKKLKKELDELKENVSKWPKKTWLRTIGNRVLDIFEKASIEITKSLAEGAVKALITSQK